MTGDMGLLVIGEVFVDLTLSARPAESKMRLGGILHAARGLWARGAPYALAAICPAYLLHDAKEYALAHGCTNFIWLGEVNGAPNVVVIGDVREVGLQGYEDVLREKREVSLNEGSGQLAKYSDVLIFPGRFDLEAVRSMLSIDASFDFDIAYDIDDLARLEAYRAGLRTVIISTSSPLFAEHASSEIGTFLQRLKEIGAKWLLLKENRGGSRVFDLESGAIEHIPAQLDRTVNSVGVGDVYSGVFSALSRQAGVVEAAWRGAQAATRYAQSTYLDDLRRDVQRDAELDIATLRVLWGTVLPWHERQQHSIYLAAPDFSYMDTPEVDQVIESLNYHNFRLRRPLQEIGELPRDASFAQRAAAFTEDFDLLKECKIVFAVPLGRDPGTLVEVGMALALSKPVIVFDPRNENNNTMVVAGSAAYSADMDDCLNQLFRTLGKPCPYTYE